MLLFSPGIRHCSQKGVEAQSLCSEIDIVFRSLSNVEPLVAAKLIGAVFRLCGYISGSGTHRNCHWIL